MRKSYACLIAVLLLAFISLPSFSQDVYSTADSSVTYIYKSPSDSTLQQKRICAEIDSLNREIIKATYHWDPDPGVWVAYRKYDMTINSDGHELFFNYYNWDADSEDWNHWVKEEKLYDKYGNLIEYIYYEKNLGEDFWTGMVWQTVHYDSLGNKILEGEHNWNSNGQNWDPKWKLERTIDSAGRETGNVRYTWRPEDDQLIQGNMEKFTYTSDSIGHTISKIKFIWDTKLEFWERSSKVEFEFDSLGRRNSRIDYLPFNQNEWNASTFTRFTFDSSGNQLLKVVSYEQSGDWIPRFKEERAFDKLGNCILIEQYHDYGTDMGWIGLGWKFTYAYNSNGQKTMQTIYDWDDILGDWKGKDKLEYSYNSAGSYTRFRDYKWNPDYSNWEIETSNEYLYSVSGYQSIRINWATDQAGIDSAVISKEFFYPGDLYYTNYDSICDGEILSWQEQEIDSEGTYNKDYKSVLGKDSTYTLKLKVNPNPEAFNISGDTDVIQGDNSLYVAPSTEEISYLWQVENGTILSGQGTDSLVINWDKFGAAIVNGHAVNIHGCYSPNSSIQVQIGPNSIEDNRSNQFNIYPVPAHDILHISTNMEFVSVEIIDMLGRCVLISSPASDVIDLSGLSTGTYLMRFKDKGNSLINTRKLLKD